MALTRRTQSAGSSMVVTIPSQIAAAFDINTGDNIEIIPLSDGKIKIKKI